MCAWRMDTTSSFASGSLGHMRSAKGRPHPRGCLQYRVPHGPTLAGASPRDGRVAPTPASGSWKSPIDTGLLTALIREAPASTAAELCWEYNRRVKPDQRTSVWGIGRARRQLGFVCKKRSRPSEVDRPDVAAKRKALLRWMKRIDPRRFLFIDESGAHLAMGRSHAWVLPGENT